MNAPLSVQAFDKIGPQITPIDPPTMEQLVSPPQSFYTNNLIQHNTDHQYFYYNSIEQTSPDPLNPHEGADTILLLQAINPQKTWSVIDSSATGLVGVGSFFVWDDKHAYFVDYQYQTHSTYQSGAWHDWSTSAFTYYIHYHPFVQLFIKELGIRGIPGLLNRQIQVDPASIPGSPTPFAFSSYQPNAPVTSPQPQEQVDFDYAGPYAPYNWELFFHVPMYIANRLATNQRFEEALGWYHYIFDPTSPDNTVHDPDTPQQKFWITQPFYLTTKADYYQQKIENLMLAIAKGDAVLRAQVDEWRNNPFNPHLIARMRTVAYQKNVLIKYLQTVVAWADQLFAQDTIESVNEATQLYVVAAEILGRRPISVPRNIPNPVKTYYQLQAEGIDDFGNSLTEMENLLPVSSSASAPGATGTELPWLDVLYFGIPKNDKLLALWDLVDDRLFKVRHCMNIEGVERQLSLVDPVIDPGLLVKAAAAGLDLGSVLADLNAPMPLYRFTTMIQRAQETCTEVRTLGTALLSVFERSDAEGMALLRSTHEQTMLTLTRQIRANQVDEASAARAALAETRAMVQHRLDYYTKLVNDGLSAWEITSLALTGGAIVAEVVSTVLGLMSAGTSLIPTVNFGAAGFGGSPHVTVSFGGQNVSHGLSKAAEASNRIGGILQTGAGMTSTLAAHDRRSQDWTYQRDLAAKEIPQLDQQIRAADIRHAITSLELSNHDKQIANAASEDDYLHTKFTNKQLYDWMVTQLSTVYFQSYQLAYDLAKRAERCYRYELGVADSSYIQFGYWDGLRKGLLAGERLGRDLKQLESAYYQQNRREYELTKHVSLATLDPVALLQLRQNGECFLDIPEAAFDLDYPGHYFRRIKTVALSVPCTVGPYATVACTLTLIGNSLRVDPTLLAGKYGRDAANEDPRFRDDITAIQSIATSSGVNDSGIFELSFRDERYLPFEGGGAISRWHLQLNQDPAQFDHATIPDVIMHLHYTAREGGANLRAKASEDVSATLNALALAGNREGLYRILDLAREFPDAYFQFLHPAAAGDDQTLLLGDLASRLPWFTTTFQGGVKARKIEVAARADGGWTYDVQLSPLGDADADLLHLQADPAYEGLLRATKDLTGREVSIANCTMKIRRTGATDWKSLPSDTFDTIYLIVNYVVE